MRVEFWPSCKAERPEIFFDLDLRPDTVDFILDVALNSKSGAVTQYNSTSAGNCLRYRVRSPAMLLTMSQNQQRKLPELVPVITLLRKGAGLDWEIRIPTDSWTIDHTNTLTDEVKEEVPV